MVNGEKKLMENENENEGKSCARIVTAVTFRWSWLRMQKSSFSQHLPAEKLTLETLEQDVKYWRYFTPCSTVSIVNFENIIAGWASTNYWPTENNFI